VTAVPLPREPTKTIVPIVSINPETGLAHELWGTAFFLGPTLLMSAKHVLGVELPEGLRLAAVFLETDGLSAFTIDRIYLDPDFDVGIAEVNGWPPDQDCLTLANHDELHINRGVLTVEYSPTTQHVPMPDGRRAMELSANRHQGHIVRDYVSDFGHEHPTACIDLSFAAFDEQAALRLSTPIMEKCWD